MFGPSDEGLWCCLDFVKARPSTSARRRVPTTHDQTRNQVAPFGEATLGDSQLKSVVRDGGRTPAMMGLLCPHQTLG